MLSLLTRNSEVRDFSVKYEAKHSRHHVFRSNSAVYKYKLPVGLLHCYLWHYLTATCGTATCGTTSLLPVALPHCYLWHYLTATCGTTSLLPMALLHCYLHNYFTVVVLSVELFMVAFSTMKYFDPTIR
ncbi:hypothetical protein EB796_004788 [Bugula neritina]|uniref:Uncharacterized protein n=1 Tax=Bugula neritina TaxID=10212 RepID=A0A7J7KE35_BUGNE|nr:hypothetical protein EB796_004946 [Bugula neritina]KAF6036910.1 hypothetical protein EB796_004788 [Bugula neritina]